MVSVTTKVKISRPIFGDAAI